MRRLTDLMLTGKLGPIACSEKILKYQAAVLTVDKYQQQQLVTLAHPFHGNTDNPRQSKGDLVHLIKKIKTYLLVATVSLNFWAL